MLERFSGADGQRRLAEAIAHQTVVNGDVSLANAITNVAQVVEYSPEAAIILQSDTDCDVYFLLSGRVSIQINGVEVATREVGTHIGEMAALDPGAPRSATVTAILPTVAARVSEAQLTALAQSHPSLWRNFAIELGKRLRQRSQFIRVPNDRPYVFIGSSAEMLPIANAIKVGLADDDIAVVVWTEGVFRPSSTALDDLLSVVQHADFGVLVVGPDDTLLQRGEETLAPRDNVVFELGLFLGAVGRHRTLLVQPRGTDLHLPTDLLGFTACEYDSDNSIPTEAGLTAACAQIRTRVLELGVK